MSVHEILMTVIARHLAVTLWVVTHANVKLITVVTGVHANVSISTNPNELCMIL